MFELLGEEPIIPSKDEQPSETIANKIIDRLRNIQVADLREEVSKPRTEVERELFGGEGTQSGAFEQHQAHYDYFGL